MQKNELISEKSKEAKYNNLGMKIFNSLTYCSVYITIGFRGSCTSVTLSLLEWNTGTTTSAIGLLVTFRGLGLLCASFITGILFNAVSRKENKKVTIFKRIFTHHSVMFFFAIVQSICLIIVPVVYNFFLLCFLMFFVGFSSCFLEIGCFNGLIGTFQKKADGVSQILQGFYGIGSLTFPLIAAIIFATVDSAKTQLILAYGICGTLCYFPSLFFLLLAKNPVIKGKEEKSNQKENESKKKELVKNQQIEDGEENLQNEGLGEDNKQKEDYEKKKASKEKKESFDKIMKVILRIILIGLVGLMKLLFIGAQIAFSSLIFIYGKRKNLSNDANLAILSSGFFITFTISRFVFGFIGSFIKALYILSFSLCGCVVVFIFFIIFSNNAIVLWICTFAFGIFASPCSACILLLLQSNFNILLSPLSTSVIMFFQYIGEMSIISIISFLSDDNILGPDGVLYSCFVCVLVTLVLFIITSSLGFVYRCIEKKTDTKNEKNKEKTELLEEKNNNEQESKKEESIINSSNKVTEPIAQ